MKYETSCNLGIAQFQKEKEEKKKNYDGKSSQCHNVNQWEEYENALSPIKH